MSVTESVNGLIFLRQFHKDTDDFCICNPVTREYIILPRQQHFTKGPPMLWGIVYGFGVGLKTNEYKVIRIFQGNRYSASRPVRLEAEVYTLGSGQWRSLGHAPYWLNGSRGPFLNGYAHWIVRDHDTPEKLCSFDFDNEIFQLFPSRPLESKVESHTRNQDLGVLKGCLCHYDSLYGFELTIWVMKEYGIKKSWHKEVVIKESITPSLDFLVCIPVYVIEGLKDGSELMGFSYKELFVYCPQTHTIKDRCYVYPPCTAMVYRPGFLKLKNFESERVHML